MQANFGAPSREDCAAFRPPTNSPQQALTLLNGPEFVEASRAMATSLLEAPGKSDAQRITQAYERALCRPPKPNELQSMLAFVNSVRQEYRQRPDDA